MKLTKFERLSLINQLEIRKALTKSGAEREDFAENIQILREGFTDLYDEVFTELYNDAPEESGRLVIDVLQMYRAIEDYKTEHPTEKV